jgi:hypothetical protein
MLNRHAIAVEREPGGFAYEVLSSGDVVISRNEKRASTLRGTAATRFLAHIETDDSQRLMARVTGNYKRGNERAAKEHPRNRSR